VPFFMRLRVLPVLLFFGTALLTLRVGTMWQEAPLMAGSPTEAQTAAPPPPAPATTAAAPAPAPTPAAQPKATPAASTEMAAAASSPTTIGTPSAAPAPAPVGATGPAQENLLGQSPRASTETAPAGGTGAAAETPAANPDQDNPFNYSDSEIELLQDLAKRRDELDKRAAALDQREALLTATEQRMDDKLAELKAVQAQIEAGLQQQKDAQDAQYKSLVKTYEAMKPKDAARIFDSLEMDVLLEVTQRMKEAKLAPVLAAMDATKAQAVTVELAARRAPTVQ
jgi:flagellar motility protein MotE (MotC chaperone)